jgi:anti-anti-sigma factor
MDVQVSLSDRIPVLTLSGRFDASGAAQFDEAVCALDNDAPIWVLDCSGVAYLSSIGLRSLVALEKTRRAREGGLILAGLTRSVRQVLELTRLDGWLRSMPTASDALDAARAAALGPVAEHLVSDRIIRVRRVAGSSSTLEWWDGTRGERLISATLGDLGFAFGTGSFEESVTDAGAAPGAFVATPMFAGGRPADARGVSDFMTGGASATLPVHIVTALGVCGAPALVAEVISQEPFRLLDAVGDLWTVATRELGSMPRTLGFIAVAVRPDGAGGLLGIGVASSWDAVRSANEWDAVLRDWPDQIPIGPGRSVVGGAVTLQVAEPGRAGADLLDAVRSIANPETLSEVVSIDVAAALAKATVWLFVPSAIRGGAEKLLQIAFDGSVDWQQEWDAIVRRLYSDCRSVTLTPLHGGYNSKTFRVVAHDRDGRRTLPTVLKIGPIALTAREERANREYVARFILNNGTTCLGGAEEGEWAGLRYNFLGVNGPDSHLVWLRDHYLQRSTKEVVSLFEMLFTRVLKPWYAQPKWEQVWLYRDHTPIHLFPNLLETAERQLGVSSDSPEFDCPELGLVLPNPFHFLKYEYPRRAAQSRLWYTSICHGDLNLQNVLVDERENVYVIDFSETRPRNAVSDFARIEPIVKFEFPRLESDEELGQLLEFEAGLTSVKRLGDAPPLVYRGDDPLVTRAHAVITLLRRSADVVTLFEQDMIPYWLAVLEWTYSVICYVQVSPRQKRYAACSAALICRALNELESENKR